MAASEENFFQPSIPKDVLEDLCSRFLINIPDNEKNNLVRICFQIELAHWYYIDFCRQDDPDLPPCGMKAFIYIIFTEFEFLNKSKLGIETIYDDWRKYKVRVPVYGAILLDDKLENCLLVQGYHNKTSWGFPKGKVNKDEGDLECAIREVKEETSYDISPIAKREQYLENTIHDHQIRLYIVAGVEKDFDFKPQTRGEIKEIRWFPIQHLPTHKKDLAPKEAFGLLANNFFMIHTFIKPLRKWINEKQDSMNARYKPLSSAKKSSSNVEQEDGSRNLLLMKLRKQESEAFRRMHALNNPLHKPTPDELALSKKDSENNLKMLLGLNIKDANTSEAKAQPPAIRKLLQGNLGVSPHKKHDDQPAVKLKKSSDEPVRNNASGEELLRMLYGGGIKSQQQQQQQKGKKSAKKAEQVIYQAGRRNSKSKQTNREKKLSDFEFLAPSFMNFKFDRRRILDALG